MTNLNDSRGGLSNGRRCREILIAYLALNVCRYADCFSIQANRIRKTAPIQQKKYYTKNLLPSEIQRIRQCEIQLYENSVVSLHKDIGKDSNVTDCGDYVEYKFQSQANDIPHDQSSYFPKTQYPLPLPATTGVNITTSATVIHKPMSDLQTMILKDKITKYMVPIATVDLIHSTCRPSEATKVIILWRNLLDDTPEIAGYPISFLSEQMMYLMQSSTTSTTNPISIDVALNATTIDWDLVSPYIDAYTFEVGGGVSGLVYGVNGVADGTRLCTTALSDVQTTIPRNFIQTGDGCLYELGRPAFSKDLAETEQIYSLDGTTKGWYRNGKETASLMIRKTKPIADEGSNELSSIDPDLLILSGLTVLVLSGAMAMEAISHHLTLNVFWV